NRNQHLLVGSSFWNPKGAQDGIVTPLLGKIEEDRHSQRSQEHQTINYHGHGSGAPKRVHAGPKISAIIIHKSKPDPKLRQFILVLLNKRILILGRIEDKAVERVIQVVILP